jgi:hypothetical protein
MPPTVGEAGVKKAEAARVQAVNEKKQKLHEKLAQEKADALAKAKADAAKQFEQAGEERAEKTSQQNFERNKANLQDIVNKAGARHAKASAALQAKKSTLEVAEKAVASEQALPANTAYSALPQFASTRGVVKIQSGASRVQAAFFKFPLRELGADIYVMTASLRLYKLGGPSGPLGVKVATCAWSRNDITYTNSLKYAGQQINVKQEYFPANSDVWVDIVLDPTMFQEARLAGEFVCFEVYGGSSAAPVVLGSEFAYNYVPYLAMRTKQTQPYVPKAKPNPGVDAPGDALLGVSRSFSRPTEVRGLEDGNFQ